jgi:hypothetical protein
MRGPKMVTGIQGNPQGKPQGKPHGKPHGNPINRKVPEKMMVMTTTAMMIPSKGESSSWDR